MKRVEDTAQVRFGVIGCGDIAVSQHLPALSANQRCEIVFVADPNLERARQAATSFGVPNVMADYTDGLKLGVEAVVVATPPTITPTIAADCAQQGIDVLCEKPLAISVEAAAKVVEVARDSKRLIQVGLKNRFHPLIQRFRDWLLDERIGRPLVLRWTAFDEVYNPDDKEHTARIRSALRTGTPLAHEVHHIDLTLWCLGPPSGVQAISTRTNPEFPADNYAAATLSFDDGSIARMEASWWMKSYPTMELQAIGPGGMLELSRPEGWLRFVGDGEVEEVVCDEDWQTVCFRGQLDAFLQARDGLPTEIPDAQVGLDVQRLVEQIDRVRLSVSQVEVE